MAGQPATDNPTLSFLMELLAEHGGLVAGRMFGYPALYLNDPDQLTPTGKPKRHLLLSVTETGVALRVPDYMVEELLAEPGFEPFAPFSMPDIKGWVLIRRDAPQDYAADLELFELALASLSG